MVTRKIEAPMCPGKKHLRIFYRTIRLAIVYVIAVICNDNVNDVVFKGHDIVDDIVTYGLCALVKST